MQVKWIWGTVFICSSLQIMEYECALFSCEFYGSSTKLMPQSLNSYRCYARHDHFWSVQNMYLHFNVPSNNFNLLRIVQISLLYYCFISTPPKKSWNFCIHFFHASTQLNKQQQQIVVCMQHEKECICINLLKKRSITINPPQKSNYLHAAIFVFVTKFSMFACVRV